MITNYSKFQHTPHTVSHDMYVRVNAADIAAMEWRHLFSEAIGNHNSTQPIGITEWTALHGRHILSIAWDWTILNDEIFSMSPNTATRTNIMLIDRCGYDTDIDTTNSACTNIIRTLGWQDVLQKMRQNRELI